MPNRLSRDLILDAPTANDLFQGQGHERIAMLLVDLINKHENANLSIGLEGYWGIGKSSIIQIVEKKINSEQLISNHRYHIFTFDIWKSQGTEIRRSILEEFLNWSIENFPDKENEIEKIQREINYTSKEIETTTTPILTWYAIAILISLPFLPIVYPQLIEFFKSIQAFNWTLIATISFYLIAMLIIYPFWDYKRNRDQDKPKERFFSSYQARISKLLLSPKQPLNHKTTYHIRETNPTSFDFQLNINKALNIVQHKNDRIIFVLDNIDRLPSSEIMTYWSLVRSLVSRGKYCREHAQTTSLKIIVPYDRNLISSAAHQADKDTNGLSHLDIKSSRNLTPISSREIFSKTFHEVIAVGPPVLADTELFFRNNLSQTLKNDVPDGDAFRCYKIFYHLLKFQGGKTTPRQIISFVNDLSMHFVLHEAAIPLPTVAAFLAHRDLLTGDPTVLNDPKKLDPWIVELASDPDLKQNLAAMIFNVDKKVALQILLDSEIVDAAESQDSNTLKTLSETIGFDLRVDDVVQRNVNHWVNTSKFPTVIENFSKCSVTSSGGRKLRYPKLLINAMILMNDVDLSDHRYRSLFLAFELANSKQRELLLKKLIQLSVSWANTHSSANSGMQFASFLVHLGRLAASNGFTEALKLELNEYHLSVSSDFLFELGGHIHNANVDFQHFRAISMNDSEHRNFEEKSVKSPLIAARALVQLQKRELVASSDWVSISNFCLNALQKADVKREDLFYLLCIVCLSVQFCSKVSRRQILESDMFVSGQFYMNLGRDDQEKAGRSYKIAFFISNLIVLNLLTISTLYYMGREVMASDFEEFLKFKEFCSRQSKPIDLKQDLFTEIHTDYIHD